MNIDEINQKHIFQHNNNIQYNMLEELLKEFFQNKQLNYEIIYYIISLLHRC